MTATVIVRAAQKAVAIVVTTHDEETEEVLAAGQEKTFHITDTNGITITEVGDEEAEASSGTSGTGDDVGEVSY